jgi:VanZ family protein
MKAIHLWRIATVIAVLGITVVSVLPSGGRAGGWDHSISSRLQNVMHVPAYAILTALACMAVHRRVTVAKVILVSVICAVYGFGLEAVQEVIPGRSASRIDATANVLGAAVGGIFALISRAWRRVGPTGCGADSTLEGAESR